MKTHRYAIVALFAAFSAVASAGELNPAAITITKPEDIKWVDNAAGTAAQSVIYGDPSKAGPYACFVKWKAGNMGRPEKK